jgi:hypothetical protein
MAYTDVYMDDFLLAAQQPSHTPLMNTLLHHINHVFTDPENSPRRWIVSTAKVQKGDASFSTKKSILGWNIDSHSMTLQLPKHRLDKIKHTLQLFLTSTYTTRKRWQKLLGELRSMVPALHSAKYLFSILQTAFHHRNTRRIRLTTILKMALQSWQHILTTANRHPVPITHLIPHAPHYYAAVDALQLGMGGFWLPTILTPDTQPVVWRHQWDDTIAKRLVTQENASGNLNNSILELAAFVTGHHVQHAHIPPLPHTTTVTATDNTPTQAWVHRGSVTTTKAPAYLLSLLAQNCRKHNARVDSCYTPGTTNIITDFLSRSFHLSDSELLTRLNRMAPVQPPWKLATLPVPWVSNMSWVLSKQPHKKELQPELVVPPTQHGPSGQHSARTYVATPSCKTYRTPCRYCKFSLKDTAWEQFLPPALQSNLERWRAPFKPWGRRSPHWVTPTRVYSPQVNLI